MKKLILYFSLLISINFSAQQADFFHLKKFKIATLPEALNETSGLTFFGNHLYTFNDSGNTSEIFEIDKKSGQIVTQITTNLPNTDWEAITNDGENFFVGDFGNNDGSRRDLKIYKIPFRENEILKDSIQNISFFYPEQRDFLPEPIRTNFDAESMFYSDIDGLLHLFTKEWKSKNITHYLINPLEFSTVQSAKKWETAPLGFVATDASFYGKKLYVVGYTKKGEVYISVFSESGNNGNLFTEKSQKFYLGSALSLGQIEGIAVNDEGIYLSSEKFRSPLGTVLPTLYFIPKEKFPLK